MKHRLSAAIGAAFLASTMLALAQDAAPLAMPPPVADNNAYPDFGYHEVPGWAKLPGGRVWGGESGVAVDRDGKSIWVFDRCDNNDGCVQHPDEDPILKFDASGKLVKSFGHGQVAFPHGIAIDAQDHVWIADGQNRSGKGGSVVREYDPDGKLLMTLGEFGVSGNDTGHFGYLSAVLVAPDGSIFVGDGHDAKGNNRVLKFDKTGKFLLQWGKLGTAPGEFNPPHGLAMDKEGRLYVADRSNSRIQIFDRNLKYIGAWKQFGQPSDIYIDKNENIYVTDATSTAKTNPGFAMGIRWGKISDGKVVGFLPWHEPNALEGVVTDDAGNIYAAFTGTRNFRKFARK